MRALRADWLSTTTGSHFCFLGVELPKSLRLVPRRPTEPAPVASTAPRPECIPTFIADRPDLHTPFLVADLHIVAHRYRQLPSALPGAALFSPLQADPAPEIPPPLAPLGSP